MSDATVLSFDDALRARRSEAPFLTDASLRAAQTRINSNDCHIAFERLTLTNKLKTEETVVFQDLSIGFPKGRKIVILGHRGVGKLKVFELAHQKLVPKRGRVIVNSRVSWPTQSANYMDNRVSVRENIIFLSRVLGLSPRNMTGTLLEFCSLEPKVLREPLKNLPNWARKRFGLVFLFACDFDCHLVNGELRGQALKLTDAQTEQALEVIYGRDYIATCDNPKLIPGNCDLVYLLHEGVFYLFEDIDKAIAVFQMLPPPAIGPVEQKDDYGEDEDELQEVLL
ncbi:MAG: hypothetical protein AAGB11_13630 [Pseudomonadota bacterium]